MTWWWLLDPGGVEVLALVGVLIAGTFVREGPGGSRRPWLRIVTALVRRPGLAALGMGLLAAVTAALLACVGPRPEPRVHDEFGYLLLADTFAHGRIANPSPPHPEAFETFHVLLHPTYTAKYPPAQGLVLALGQVLTGDPIAGLWLSALVSVASLCWMLQAWVGPRWALVGALLAIAQVSLTYWSQSYWGGSIAAAGGALLLGAFRRLERRPSLGQGAAFALGLSTLANSRPYEGLVLSLPALVLLPWWLLRRVRRGERRAPALATAGLVLVLVPVLVAMAVYNRHVTGSALTLPYAAYNRQSGAAGAFPWARLPARPVSTIREIARYQDEYEHRRFLVQHTPDGFVRSRVERLGRLASFYIGLPLALSLLSLRALLRSPGPRRALCWLALLVAGILLPVSSQVHYAAPGLALLLVVQVLGLRALRRRFLRPPLGRFLVAAVVLSLFAGNAMRLARREGAELRLWPERRQVAERLARDDVADLVFVSYAPWHNVHDEWVFNGADLRSTPVIWARSLGSAADAAVAADWPARKTWILRADKVPPRLRPYTPSAGVR